MNAKDVEMGGDRIHLYSFYIVGSYYFQLSSSKVCPVLYDLGMCIFIFVCLKVLFKMFEFIFNTMIENLRFNFYILVTLGHFLFLLLSSFLPSPPPQSLLCLGKVKRPLLHSDYYLIVSNCMEHSF